MRILAVDPGSAQTGWVLLSQERRSAPVTVEAHDTTANLEFLEALRVGMVPGQDGYMLYDTVVIEWVQSYGMAVGIEMFDMVRWVGRFAEALDRYGGCTVRYVTRMAVKMHLCNSPKAKDVNVRTVLMDRFGGSGAKGTKNAPGPLHGIGGNDQWAALAVGMTWLEQLWGSQ